MPSIINATTTNGVVIQPDNSGSLVLQTNSGTTALTIDTSQRAAFVAGTASLPAITTTGDTNTGIFFPAADTIAFAEGGTETMRLDSSGNVGIGTASPNGKLGVVTATSATAFNSNNNLDTGFQVNYVSGLTSIGNNFNNPLAFLTNNTERMRIDSSGNLLFNSGYGSVATAFGCRAWVNFTGSSGAINGSGNVSSVTRNGVGQYTVNITTAMPNANYAAVMGGAFDTAGNCRMLGTYATSTSAILVKSINTTGAYLELAQGYVAVFR